MKSVLILGAGMVAKPMIEYLLENGFRVVVASPMKDRADEMINRHPAGVSVDWSMDEPAVLETLIAGNDITVSLLPYKYHTDVAKVCLKCKKSLVTTSYIQPAMMEMDEEAKRSGLIFLNETGLDPGIDHMTAMRIIDHIHSDGGKVKGFYSLCGALPAPEAADNPMGYKFSWSPKGVILASRNSALYLKKGKQIYIEPADLFKDSFIYYFPGVGNLEVYPNRDSVSYINIYGIPETETMYRGTFRFPGWCETLDAMKNINMLDDYVKDYQGLTYSEYIAERAGLRNKDLRKNLAARLKVDEDSPVIRSFDFLGFFDDEILNYQETSPFEITSDRMIRKMLMKNDERDMVILQHVFLAERNDGSHEVIRSSMLDYGIPGSNTSIARTVALPAAIAVKMITEGKIAINGVCRPISPEIYNPVLEELSTLGVVMKEEYGLGEEEMIP